MVKRSIVAEIVGPSGAGKSLLSSHLDSMDVGIRAGLTVWRLPRARLTLSGMGSIPDIVGVAIERRGLRMSEVKQVIRLRALYRMLEAGRFASHRYVFLDEGAVFALAKLRADLGQGSFGTRMTRWEAGVVDLWTSMLDLIVWLDASDDILIRRIRTRAKDHRMKKERDVTVRDFLCRYREAYRSVIEEIASRKGIQVLRFQTDDAEPREIANEILSTCREIGGDRQEALARTDLDAASALAR